MTPKKINILLADDDHSDCLLFKDALQELPISAHLTVVHDGEQVIDELSRRGKNLPHILFLDLNMPRKNGFAALGEIKRHPLLQQLPVVVYSTSSVGEVVNQVFKDAAHYYICKPADFSKLKKVIYEALTLVVQNRSSLPLKDKFLITGDAVQIPDNTER